jgi:purine catabolism regulator
MAFAVHDIVSIPGMPLKLLAGEEGADRPVRWVHSSELEDPTAWLKGGELILTTGMGVGDTVAKQRAYIRRLVDAGVAGLGFGLGFGHDKTPRALVTEAAKHGFPLFEVPYPVPFIAITEAVFTRAIAEQYDTLQRAVDAEHVLTRAVLEGGGVDGVARSLAGVVEGWALVLDLHGMSLAATDPEAEARRERIWDEVRTSRPEAATFSLTMLDEGYHVWVQPVGAQGRIEAFLAVGTPEQPTQLDRIVAGHALSLFAIELAKSRAVAEAERRLQGDFFDELVRGELAPADASRGLARFGFARDATVFVVAIEPVDAAIEPGALALAATDHRSRREGGFVISAGADGISMLLPATAASELPELVKGIGQRIDAELRAGAGGPVDAASVGRSMRATPCRSADSRDGSTRASNSSARTGCCSA